MSTKKLAAEAIGTFWLTFAGCGSAVIAAGFPQVGIGLLGVSLAFGLTVVTMAYAIGNISGCHLNPAVTIGLWAGGRFPARDIPLYIGAQVLGAIVAAFLHQPKLIIMDEPFVGLDPIAAHTLKELMQEHCAGGGAIFFSTHVLEVAEKLCDKVAIIKEGRLIASGTMAEVRGNSSLEDVFLELEGDEK